MNLDSIPTDLIFEIFSRLPTKSIARFHCLSKLWESIHSFACGYASGLIYFYRMWIEEKEYNRPVICNPNTGQYATLPYLQRYRKSYSFFGFDPIDKQFKVLFMPYATGPDRPKILTLGTGEMKWRKIKCPLRVDVISEGICINGVLYFLCDTSQCRHIELSYFVIVCFDVRYEKFKFINVETFCELINYKGKLGAIYWEDDDDVNLRVWILEDVEKQEWSKYAYTLDRGYVYRDYVSIVGATATGEIIFSERRYTPNHPFYVFYFNPKKNTLQRVEIQGFGEYYHDTSKNHNVYTFVNHVEDLNVNDPKLLKSCIYASYVEIYKEFYEESESEEEGEEQHNYSKYV